MKLESVAFAIAGVCFGLMVGWIIGSQQPGAARPPAVSQTAQAPPQSAAGPETPPPAILDEAKVRALQTVAEGDPKNAEARTQLGNLYYDSGRYADAIKWYEASLAINPNDVNVSTDLGVSLYYLNQTDKAIAQLEHSLAIDPTHTKTLLNIGVVRAFGMKDLKGAAEAWKRVVEISPQSPEGQAARQALESITKAHQNLNQ
jgi:tetratricopeptide (TPR) repeat protein